MSRNSPIRIRQKDVELIKKLNVSAKRKQNRLRKNFNVNIDMTLRGVETFSTRKEFNQYVKQLQTFTDRKNFRYIRNEEGLVMPREMLNEIKKAVKEANKVRKQVSKQILPKEMTVAGKGSGFTVGESTYMMGQGKFQYLKPIELNIDRFRNIKEAEEYLKRVKEQNTLEAFKERDKTYKENYMKALTSTFGNQAKKLKKLVKKMSLANFMKVYYSENLAGIDFIYDFEEAKSKLETLMTIFENA